MVRQENYTNNLLKDLKIPIQTQNQQINAVPSNKTFMHQSFFLKKENKKEIILLEKHKKGCNLSTQEVYKGRTKKLKKQESYCLKFI